MSSDTNTSDDDLTRILTDVYALTAEDHFVPAAETDVWADLIAWRDDAVAQAACTEETVVERAEPRRRPVPTFRRPPVVSRRGR